MCIYVAIQCQASLVYFYVHVPRLSLSCLYLPILTVNYGVYNEPYGKIDRLDWAVRWHFNGNHFARKGEMCIYEFN